MNIMAFILSPDDGTMDLAIKLLVIIPPEQVRNFRTRFAIF